MQISTVKGFKKTHLTVDDCEALARSAEGSSSLTQPLSQRKSRGDVNRGLYPTQRTRRRQGGQGQQKNITDYFSVSQVQQVGAGGTKNSRIKEEVLDPIFTDPDDSFSDVSTKMETSGDSCSFLEDEDLVPAPRESSRKRPLSTAAAGVCKPEHDLWGEPEKKPMVGLPENIQIKQELDDMEIEPVPDAHYGLLGTRNWEVPQGSIDDLPVEVLRHIFAFLPVTDLYQNLSLVCRCWREIVSDPLFIPWKKLYHRYLMKEDMALHRVEQILEVFAITKEQEGCVWGLIRCVSAISTERKVDPSAVLRCLKRHHLFSKAEVCITNKLPHLQSRTGLENLWAIIAVMVLFSDGVSDIQKLMACLQRPCSTLSVVDVTEVLYCIATLLYAMRDRNIAITNRIHYNIFYCLYLMENTSVTMQMVKEETPMSRCRQDLWSGSWPEVKLTHEQQRILNHKIEHGQIVKIMAFAGTGKTSTLVKYAEKFADLNFLYVTFNKAVAERGKSVFPRNVTCKTFHSLAFGSVGKHYKEKGRLNFSKMSVYSISFLIQNREGQSLFVRGKTVSQTLENFFASSDDEICEEHAPIWFKNTHGERKLVSQEEKRINVEEAKEIWHNMKKLDGDIEKKYKITCDGYLKLWQLSKPQLLGYDAIFVDEAQDCTPAIVDIVLSQKCGIILVGDPHQQIYTFRGAVNTLYSVPHTHVYYLTQSFRFGPEIAYVGATILDVCKKIRNKTLVGGNQKGDVRGSMEGKITVLSRSNFNVFEDAVKLTGRERLIKIHVIGGLARFGLSRIYDIWKLSQPADERKKANLVINDSFIKRWEETQGFFGLKEYAERIDDKDLEVKIAIVEKYKERIPELVQKIESSHVSQEAMADYLIGTVHQAKGLEFDMVLVADDFVKVPCLSGDYQRRTNFSIGMYPEDEWNLLYVAVTRAKKCLLMSKSLEHLLALAGEHFLRVELMSEAAKDGATLPCSAPQCTGTLPSDCRLVVKKLPLTHSNGSKDAGGYLCHACTQQRFGSLTPLTFFPALQEQPI
ncbi:F-box DNA helicase 1 isoform X1 [Rissa tridactyla]|uniref:F-box DNA helicase 1 isoform X1 n=2 Tax=Rissa tridactyla TaxID=75485 RepID=UPI0023BAC28E|nr:F-box DNA helicase 1 isoform X1 [Rissa tridactyla]XP_054043780.1 F-box DNA helicase 1 isoform X1 [Rissa tridactyla]XP_054043885.1 F-box DNA helicase 1 isoform X1 [Rissa tridactyla]